MKIRYKKIFQDILKMKFPENEELFKIVSNKEIKNSYDVLKLNQLIFDKKLKVNKHKSYDKAAVIEILTYQKENKLTNVEISKVFGVSRNTITSWKKKYLIS